MRRVLAITALTILLSLSSILFVSVFSFGHHGTHHLTHSEDCPFMSHEEAVCPMSALDHLSLLRSIFETVLPDLISLTVAIGALALVFYLEPVVRPRWRIHTRTFLRWRRLVIHHFEYRLFQSLFARGILHPKLFS